MREIERVGVCTVSSAVCAKRQTREDGEDGEGPCGGR